MKKRKWIAAALTAVLALQMLAGCSSEKKDEPASKTEKEEGSGDKKDGKVLKIGFSWSHKNDSLFYSFDKALTKAMDETCKDNGYDSVEWVHVVAEDDADKQAADISDLLTQKCDVIVAYAFDNVAIASSAKECKDAGVPFVLYDRNMAPEAEPKADLFVGLDTTNQAYLAGKAFFQQMKDAGEEPKDIISIMGATNDTNALNREKGFKKAAEEFGYTIKQEVPSDWDAEKALTGFSAAFQANPDTNCVLIASDFIVTAVQSVLESNDAWHPNGEKGHVWICSQDGFPTGIKFMQEKYMDCSGMYDVDAMGKNFAAAIYDIIKGTYDGPAEVYSDPMVVKADEVDSMDLWGKNYMDEAEGN